MATDITATPCPDCLAPKSEWCKDRDGKVRGGALLAHPVRRQGRVVWEGVGRACKYLAVFENEGRFYGIALDPAIKRVRGESWYIEADTLTDAIDDVVNGDLELFHTMRVL